MSKQYSAYKPTGVEWIGDIPEHWEVKRLKYVASANPSNIDKKSVEGELPVRLCNYTDVYKNEFITADMPFMSATANPAQIAKFSLKKGDVLATKDSEDPEDIAVPAVVIEDLDEVVCGYHLTHIKSNPKYLNGFYLFRLFQSDTFNKQFTVQANGITRYGLSTDAFGNALLCLPPFNEQITIAKYLDQKTALIDETILKKQHLIGLLKEERIALINQAVTRGLNPNAQLKPSGVDWLGDVPEHWILSKVGFVANVVRGASPRPAGDPRFFSGNHTPWITVAEVTKDSEKYLTSVSDFLTEEGRQHSRVVESGTLLLSNSGATLGVPKILQITGCINDGSVAFLNPRNVSIDFLYYYFTSLTKTYREMMKGSGQPNLNTDIVKMTPLPLPTLHEQRDIVEYIEGQITTIKATTQKVEKEISLLQEYRTAIINEVVTGKRCVVHQKEEVYA